MHEINQTTGKPKPSKKITVPNPAITYNRYIPQKAIIRTSASFTLTIPLFDNP